MTTAHKNLNTSPRKRLWQHEFWRPDVSVSVRGMYDIAPHETIELIVRPGAPFNPKKLIVYESVSESTITKLFRHGTEMTPGCYEIRRPLVSLLEAGSLLPGTIDAECFLWPVNDGHGLRLDEIIAKVTNTTDRSCAWRGVLIGPVLSWVI